MGKKFKTTSYTEETRPASKAAESSSHSHSSYKPAAEFTPDDSQPTNSEKNKVVGFSILVLVVGVILTPILIGIPIIAIGFWMMAFPGYWVKKAKRS